MEKTPISLPQRLFYIRVCVTLALIISFLLSFKLWGGEAAFPDIPMFENFYLKAPYGNLFVVLSMLFLLCSLFLKNHRLFIFLSLLLNIFLVLFDVNRLQPWFYVYNAVLFVLLFYNGRVDETGKFTSSFIIIQLIIASVYIYNGINQLNINFLETDYYNTISPLAKIVSERQFLFFMNAGKFVPYFIIFIGFGLMIRPLRFLILPAVWIFHFALLILLFPSSKSPNYALWLMNLIFGLLILFLFAGKTRQRYYNWSLLLQKPLFYIIFFAFWIVPLFNYINYWPKSPTANFMYGKTNRESLLITENTYNRLPVYLQYFCTKNAGDYVLGVSEWCRHELKSEYTKHAAFNNILIEESIQITSTDVKETEEELSSL